MKTLFVIVLLFFTAVSLVGCGGEGSLTTTPTGDLTTTEIPTTTTQDPTTSLMDEIYLLYSGSYSNFHDFNEPITWITSYNEYLNSDYSFELNERFFDDYSLYTYAFVYSNLGKDIFLYDTYLIVDNILFITCRPADEGQVSPAFGDYAIVFAIPKIMLGEDIEVFLSLSGGTDMIFDNSTTIRSMARLKLLYFEITEDHEFGINFDREGVWPITAITGRLFNISDNQEISMTMFSGLYGYHAILEPGQYVFILDIGNNDEEDDLFYIFDYHAKLHKLNSTEFWSNTITEEFLLDTEFTSIDAAEEFLIEYKTNDMTYYSVDAFSDLSNTLDQLTTLIVDRSGLPESDKCEKDHCQYIIIPLFSTWIFDDYNLDSSYADGTITFSISIVPSVLPATMVKVLVLRVDSDYSYEIVINPED